MTTDRAAVGRFWQAGKLYEFPEAEAACLIAAGQAVSVESAAVEPPAHDGRPNVLKRIPSRRG